MAILKTLLHAGSHYGQRSRSNVAGAAYREVRKLQDGIRRHRDGTLHELCWHHPALWGLLPEKSDPVPVVPAWPQFLQGCIKYRQSLDDQAPEAPRTEIPDPE